VASNPRIDDLRKRLEKEPGSRLFAQLAEELRKDGEFEEAIRIARAGLSRHPSYPSARMTLGRALFDTGDMAAAREELQTVLNGAPDNILASRLLAECLEALGDLEAALGRYRATLALSPGDKHILARVRELEAKPQAAAHPASGAAGAPAKPPDAIPLATVDEPMELEVSQEGPAPGPEAAPIPLVETSAEFELESAYDAPGTQWRTTETPAAPTSAAPVADTPQMMHDPPLGERTLVDEPAPTIAIKPAPAPPEVREPAPAVAAAAPEPEASFEYAFDPPAEAPAPPARQPPAPPPSAPVIPRMPEAAAVVAAPVVAAPEAPEPVATPDFLVPPAPATADVPALPPPVAVAPAPAAAPAASEGELASPTLAELYFNQGFPEKAIEVYRRLLDLEPANARARARLAELHELVAARAAPATGAGAGAPPAYAGEPPGPRDSDEARAARRRALERTIERLESLRAALQKGPR
jgi:tetratricopeptide (TPR) repeat protein